MKILMRDAVARVAGPGFAGATAATITGLLLGTALGLMATAGLFAAAFITIAAIGVLVVIAPRVAGGIDRPFVIRGVLLAFAVRAAVAAVLFTASNAIGRGGSVTGDDAAFADISWAFVRWLRGEPQWPDVPPTWNGQDYLFGTFVYIESALFFVIGRDMLAMQIINGALAATCYAVLFDMARRLFGVASARLTLAAVAVYPSLVLWSSLNLKEAYIVLAVTVLLAMLLRMGTRPSVVALALSYVLIETLQSMRSYSFVGLIIVVPIGVVLIRAFRPAQRLRWTAASIVASAALLSFSPWLPFATNLRYLLENIEITRRAQAEFARTGFTDPRSIAVSTGETLYVPT
ncbi:MAG: hypothetical protein FJ028_07585, partial [Chloroflexi bacterium]|nr:hypothetical protein [Chloroflexota bacterium]